MTNDFNARLKVYREGLASYYRDFEAELRDYDSIPLFNYILDIIARTVLDFKKQDTELKVYESNPFFMMELINWTLLAYKDSGNYKGGCDMYYISVSIDSRTRDKYQFLKLADEMPMAEMNEYAAKVTKLVEDRIKLLAA